MDTAIRFTFNAIKVGKDQTLVHYYTDPAGRITVTAKSYCGHFGAEVRAAFAVVNQTDLHTDYFDKDRIEVLPTHERYRDVASGALAYSRHELKGAYRHQAKYQAKYGPAWKYDGIERHEKTIAYLEQVIARGSVGGPFDTGPVPTPADEAKAERDARVAAKVAALDADHAAADADRVARLAASMDDVPLTTERPALRVIAGGQAPSKVSERLHRYEIRKSLAPVAVSEPLGAQIVTPETLAGALRAIFADLPPDRESFVAVSLDVRSVAIGFEVVATGTLTGVEVHPREVFRAAILAGAAAICVAHNHPSGDPSPSDNDVTLTERLRAAGTLVGIPVLDHVVVGDGTRYYSFASAGRL